MPCSLYIHPLVFFSHVTTSNIDPVHMWALEVVLVTRLPRATKHLVRTEHLEVLPKYIGKPQPPDSPQTRNDYVTVQRCFSAQLLFTPCRQLLVRLSVRDHLYNVHLGPSMNRLCLFSLALFVPTQAPPSSRRQPTALLPTFPSCHLSPIQEMIIVTPQTWPNLSFAEFYFPKKAEVLVHVFPYRCTVTVRSALNKRVRTHCKLHT